MTFQSFGLSEQLLQSISELAHTTPTPIQYKAIPAILNGSDVMALAQTGTGKTAAFTLPLLQRLSATHDPAKSKRTLRALILTPTRELAAQVGESVKHYGSHLPLHAEVIFGGVNITPQIRKLHKGADILVATPGRLLDLVNQQVISLSKVEILVLDEADRMLDMGFIHDIRKILALLPRKRQNMLFSATISQEIQNLAAGILHNHQLIEVAPRNISTELVNQMVYQVDQKRKRELLSYIIGFNNWKQVLVFTRTKHTANRLCAQLIEDGLNAAAIHGNKSQGARTRALEEFKNGAVRVLVATDIAARGLDIEQLPHVINFELPSVPQDYVHRIGRTGRAGNTGNAISLVCAQEVQLLVDIEKLTKKTIARKIIPGYEPEIQSRPIINPKRSDQSTRSKTSRHRSPNMVKDTKSTARFKSGQKYNGPKAEVTYISQPRKTNKDGNFRSRTEFHSRKDEPNGNKRNNWRTDTRTHASDNVNHKRKPYRSEFSPQERTFATNGNRSTWTPNPHKHVRTNERGKDSKWNTASKPTNRASQGSSEKRNDWRSNNKPNNRINADRRNPAAGGRFARRGTNV